MLTLADSTQDATPGTLDDLPSYEEYYRGNLSNREWSPSRSPRSPRKDRIPSPRSKSHPKSSTGWGQPTRRHRDSSDPSFGNNRHVGLMLAPVPGKEPVVINPLAVAESMFFSEEIAGAVRLTGIPRIVTKVCGKCFNLNFLKLEEISTTLEFQAQFSKCLKFVFF